MPAISNETELGLNSTAVPVPTQSVVIIVAYAIILPIALLGNIFVVRTICTITPMRTPTNIMFLNMALFDIIVALTMMPIQISHVFHPFRWIGGLAGIVTCKLLYYASYISIAGSIASLVVMAFDRFFAIVLPLLNFRFFKRYRLLTVMIWLMSMIFMLPIVILQDVKEFDGFYYCSTDWWRLSKPRESYRIFIILILVVLYLFPLIVMTVLYSLIAHRLWFTRIPGMSSTTDVAAKRVVKKKRKVVKMLVIVLAVFALCWLPVQIAHSAMLSLVQYPPEFITFSFWLSNANSAINPCLYVILHSGFRRAFLELCPCWKRMSCANNSQSAATDCSNGYVNSPQVNCGIAPVRGALRKKV